MTVAVRTTAVDVQRPDTFAGLGIVLRLSARRERWSLAFWTLGVVGTVVSSVGAIAGLYPDTADRQQLAITISANPAFLALTGRVGATSVGGVTAWRVGVLGGLAIALMSVLTVVRRTRGDEEAGRAELLASGVVGRNTLLSGGLLLAWAPATGIGLLSALGLIAGGQPVGGSLALAAELIGPGLVMASVAAVFAQIFDSARAASGAACAVLGAAFALRAAGDLSAAGSWLSSSSPLGWGQQVDAFGRNRWWVALLFVAVAAGLAAVAHQLSVRRDLDQGLLGVRSGAATSPGLRSGFPLALRLHRAALLGWAVGFLLLGLLTASLADTAGSLLADNPRLAEFMRDLGGGGSLSDELLSTMAGISGLTAAGYAISSALRIRAEESSGRAELLLSTGVSRVRWFGGQLLVSLGGSALLLLISGTASGLLYAAETDAAGGFGAGFFSTVVQLPAVLVLGGLTAALIGWTPRLASAAWGVLGAVLLLGQVGALLRLPRWVLDASPFSHVPSLPGGELRWTPIVALLVVSAVLVAAGLAGCRRRDVG